MNAKEKRAAERAKQAQCEYTLHGIPNTEAGRAAVAIIKKHFNRGRYTRVRVRGNGPRSAPAKADGTHASVYHQDLPLKHARTLRVYFDDPKRGTQLSADYWQRRMETVAAERNQLTEEVRTTREALANLAADRNELARALSLNESASRITHDAAVHAARQESKRVGLELAAVVRVLLQQIPSGCNEDADAARTVATAILNKHGV